MMSRMIAAIPLMLASGTAVAAPDEAKNFIVACALFQLDVPASKRVHNDLNLLVSKAESENGTSKVIETYDPEHLLPTEGFVNVSFDRSGTTKFTALTGPMHASGTKLLGGTLVEEGAYDVLLGEVGTRKISHKGRCWMSNVANADVEFNNLKAGRTAP